MPDARSKGRPGAVNLETHPLVARLHADPQAGGLYTLRSKASFYAFCQHEFTVSS